MPFVNVRARLVNQAGLDRKLRLEITDLVLKPTRPVLLFTNKGYFAGKPLLLRLFFSLV